MSEQPSLHESLPWADPLRYVAEIVLNENGIYGDPILALTDFLAGEFADEDLGRKLAAKGFAS